MISRNQIFRTYNSKSRAKSSLISNLFIHVVQWTRWVQSMKNLRSNILPDCPFKHSFFFPLSSHDPFITHPPPLLSCGSRRDGQGNSLLENLQGTNKHPTLISPYYEDTDNNLEETYLPYYEDTDNNLEETYLPY